MDTSPEQVRNDWQGGYGRNCPSRTVLEVIGSEWALLVLGALRRREGPMRFSELRRLLDGITQKMLTKTVNYQCALW